MKNHILIVIQLISVTIKKSEEKHQYCKVILPAPMETDDLRADYTSLGLTLGRHPMAMLRDTGEPFSQCKTSKELEDLSHGRFVKVSGIVTGRQRPSSASGVYFSPWKMKLTTLMW